MIQHLNDVILISFHHKNIMNNGSFVDSNTSQSVQECVEVSAPRNTSLKVASIKVKAAFGEVSFCNLWLKCFIKTNLVIMFKNVPKHNISFSND